LQALQVVHEEGVLIAKVLQALEILFKDGVGCIGDAVDHPVGPPFTFHQAVAFQVGEVLGDFHLGFSQNLLNVTNTERILPEKVEDSQACHVTQATIDPAEFLRIHGLNIPLKVYTCKGILLQSGLAVDLNNELLKSLKKR
jgi:hypothetical protein|tara:strand:+ start:74 stop:496 length:423 start_codon:yes stop_codon:yes gene_type:complete